MQRKKMLIAVLSIALLVGVVTAAIPWFGQIKVTTTVTQAILLDGKGYADMPIEETATVAGGESFCRPHWLTSQTSVPVNVGFETTGLSEGITVSYWKIAWYKTVKTTPDESGTIIATINVEDIGASVKWTIDMDETCGYFKNGHAAVGLVIGIGDKIVFQVHDNDGTDFHYSWGTWLLSYWDNIHGTPWNGWHTGSPDYWNIPITEVNGIEATGERDLVSNPTLGFTITINKGWLGCGEFKWAMALMGDTSDTYTPSTFSWADANTNHFHTATVGTEITAPFVLQPKEKLDFCIGYKFAELIGSGTYTIYSTVKPAP